MSDFEVRPVGDYRAPRYPASDEAQGDPKPPMISNRRPVLAAWTLAAIAPLAAFPGRATPKSSEISLRQGQESPTKPPVESAIQRLTDTELESLVADLKAGTERATAVDGDRAAISAVLTEAEARVILTAFLKKNGYEPKRLTIAPGGHSIEVDALDAARGVGVAFLPGKQRYGGNRENAGPRPTEAIDELMLLRARGEARVLVLDGSDFEYDSDGNWAGVLPTKKAAVQRMLAALENFLRAP